jgi:hypothetical protein
LNGSKEDLRGAVYSRTIANRTRTKNEPPNWWTGESVPRNERTENLNETARRSQFQTCSLRQLAVKGLRSQSLAPINARKKQRAPLTAAPATAGKVNKGAVAPHLKIGKKILAQAEFSS